MKMLARKAALINIFFLTVSLLASYGLGKLYEPSPLWVFLIAFPIYTFIQTRAICPKCAKKVGWNRYEFSSAAWFGGCRDCRHNKGK